MKKLFKPLVLLLAIVASAATVRAQQMPPIPVDSMVRIGKLDNGLTYYIRANKLPENRANFYIVQKVGSMQEEESQRGLAHFLEHMAFNGTKHFPSGGRTLISYLESIGVKFGTNLNAYTSMDETVYNINDVPVTVPGAIDSCLLILNDWACDLTLAADEIDKERKVIHEEWRTRRDASQRMIDSIAPVIFKDSKYAHRMPIGLMSVVDNFAPQVLRDYYHKWYRPDLQGIIVVGDVDVDAIEAKIKTLFGAIPKPVNPAERVYEQIPDNDQPLVAIAIDKEMSATNVMISFKRNVVPNDQKSSIQYLVYEFATSMIRRMLNDRLQEMLQKNNPPFAFATVSNGSYFGVRTKDALSLNGVARPNEVNLTMNTLLREVKRAHDFGFTEGEYERAKADYKSALERLYNERDKQRSSFYIQQYVLHFLENTPIPSVEDRYNIINQFVDMVPLAAINQIMQQMMTEKNRVVVLMGTEAERASYPTAEQIAATVKQIDGEKLEPYADNTVKEPLMAELPAKGSVVKETVDNDRKFTLWTLSNGARVAVRETDFKQDEIMLSGQALGGTNLMPDKDLVEIKLIDDLAGVGGLGKFSVTDLKKALSGKNAGVNTNIGQYDQTVSGRSNVKDLETMMQLLYLSFTAPRKDVEAFQSMAGRLKGVLPMLANNPDFVFTDSLTQTVYMNHPRVQIPTAADIDACNYDRLLELYRERFANAADYTFVFVGNVSPAKLKPLVEQYIASLPGTKPTAPAKDMLPQRTGRYNNNFVRELETPKASTAIIYSGDLAYTPENVILMDILKQTLDMEFTEKIREEKGGTYGVSVRGSLDNIPRETVSLRIQFDTDPERRTELVDAIEAVVTSMQQNGPNAEQLQKVKEYMLKQHADDLKENGHVLNTLLEYVTFGVDFDADYAKRVEGVTIDAVKQFAAKLIGQGNRIEVSMSSK